MESSQIEFDDELNPQVEKEAPEAPAEKTDTENQELLKKFQSAEAQKEHWREKAMKFEEQLKAVKPQQEEVKKEVINSFTTDPKDIVRLTKALNGFDEEETTFIYRNAKNPSDPNSVIEASKDSWVIDAIERKRERVAKENSIPSPSTPSVSTFEMDAEEAATDRDKHMKFWEEQQKKRAGASGI